MKLSHIILAALVGCFAFSFIACNKQSNGIPPVPTTNTFLKGANGPPLWLVNNVEVVSPYEKSSLKIKPDNIQSVTVLSPASENNLVSRYGPKAKNGVILVVTKKAGK